MDKLLACWEKQKKDKHGKHCHDKNKHFSPFVLSVGGMLKKESLVILTTLSQLMAEKTEEPIPHIRGWVNGRIAIAVTGSYSPMIFKARLPSPLRYREPNWDTVLGLGLGAMNSAPEKQFAHTRAIVLSANVTCPPPLSAHRACSVIA